MVFGFIKQAGQFLANKAGKLFNKIKDDPLGSFVQGAKLLTGVDPTKDIQQIAQQGSKAISGVLQGITGGKKVLSGDVAGGLADIASGVGTAFEQGEKALGGATGLASRLAQGFTTM